MADGGIPSARPARARTLQVGDLFCGAGGLSTGAARAVRELGSRMNLVGVNHWPVAIETNKRNHPEHAPSIRCANLESALPLDHVPGGALDLLMAAPSCVFHSRARGGRPVHDQQRMDPWHVVRWCTELRVKRILIENVPEFVDWGPCSLVTGRPIKNRKGEYFRAWIAALEAIGFRIKYRVLCTADYGDPTTRRRFFLIGCSDRQALRWPEPTHAADGAVDLLGARERWRGAAEIIDWTRRGSSIFTRKKPLAENTLRRIRAGAVRYGWPQVYVDAIDALMAGREPVLDVPAEAAQPMLVHFRGTSAHALDNTARALGDPLPTLTAGGGHVGLVMATGAGGVARDLAQPIPTVTAGGDGGARPQLIEPLIVMRTNSEGGRNARPTSEPAPTVCTRGAGYLAQPLVVPITHHGERKVHGVEHPLPTVTGANRGELAIAQPLVAPYYGGGSGLTATSAAEPIPSVTTKGRFGLAEAVVMRGNVGTGRTRDMRAASAPLQTITGSESLALAQPFLVPNLGENGGQAPRTHSIAAPLPTVTASGHIQLAQPVADGVRIDIHYRRLHWRELAAATSFDDEGEVYDFAGNGTEITKQIGNAVPCRTGKALVRALLEDLA